MRPRDNVRRYLMLGVALCWLVTGIAYTRVSESHRWNPHVVAALAFSAAILTIWFALFPQHIVAYRLAGTAAVGTLLFRTASVVMALWLVGDPDTIWIALSWIGTTAMLFLLYGRWWLYDVGPWHARFRDRGRDDPG